MKSELDNDDVLVIMERKGAYNNKKENVGKIIHLLYLLGGIGMVLTWMCMCYTPPYT